MKHRLRTKTTRAQFEKLLGGNFKPQKGNEVYRSNGRWATYKAHSKEAQERIDCFCRDLLGKVTLSGKDWHELKQHLEAQNGNG